MKAATSYSNERLTEKAAETAAQEALEKAGLSKSSTALVFASIHHRRHYADMLKKIRRITQAKQVVGASGYGVITEEGEREEGPSLAVMVLDSTKVEAASLLVRNLQEGNLRAGESMGELIKESGFNPSLLLAFPDAFSFQSHLFFDGFESACGFVPMIGGSASEDGRAGKAYQWEGEEVIFDGVSALALEGNLRLEIGITQSCQPFGEPIQVTRSDGNMIYEMDGRPAYDILLESLSEIELLAAGRENPREIFQRVFLGVPLSSYQTDFSKSRYLIRNIMSINAKNGMLACITPVEEGEFVTFAVRDPERARRDMERMLAEVREHLDPAEARFGFYFNCCARGQSLYGIPDQDTLLIRNFFPHVPILGFFSYGEIAPVDHVNHLHHYSGVLALVAENS